MFEFPTRWFTQSAASQAYTHNDRIILCAILATGAFLRFWGLGNVGLHGDEETMAMSAIAILKTGQPLLPSGMYYPRGLLNTYLIAGSVWLFGESEWAMRLPSAIVGSVTGLVAFFAGRRFLPPQFNLAFVATIALWPDLIVLSQTARMYVFLVTCLLWFAACVFRWERDQRLPSLALAVLVWILALLFHQLAIFAALLFIYPGLSRQSWSQTIQGAIAFALSFLLFVPYNSWIVSRYPHEGQRLVVAQTGEAQGTAGALGLFGPNFSSNWHTIALVAVSAIVSAWLIRRTVERTGWKGTGPVLLCCGGLAAVAVVQYHIAAILLFLGTVFWMRGRGLPRSWSGIPIALAATMAGIQMVSLHESGLDPGLRLLGVVLGSPSILPLLRFMESTGVTPVLFLAVSLYFLTRFATCRPLPVHFLFFAVAVWAPLFLMGYFGKYIETNYASGQLGAFLLCTFAAIASLTTERNWAIDRDRLSRPMVAILVVITAVVIDPRLLASTVVAGYERSPDHKGAARFIQDLQLGPEAVLIAEDVLQQTYYLGKVDYSLRPIDDAVFFSIVRDGRLIDQYTGVPVIGTGDDLNRTLTANQGRPVYIIGSGENFYGGERKLRGQGINEVLMSDRLEVVFEGRDKKTRIWKLR